MKPAAPKLELPPAAVAPNEPASLLAPAASAPLPAETPAAPTLDEQSLMNTLRDVGDSAPLYSLEMARDGNARFPNSPEAAERSWYICKSLVNLENFYDAREEARRMVAEYPGTPWAADVERHLLVNPLNLPGDTPQ